MPVLSFGSGLLDGSGQQSGCAATGTGTTPANTSNVAKTKLPRNSYIFIAFSFGGQRVRPERIERAMLSVDWALASALD